MGTGNFLLNRTGGYDPQAQRSVRPAAAWEPIYVLAWTEVIYSMDGFTYSLEIYCFF